MIDSQVSHISQRLSLRPPQVRALALLAKAAQTLDVGQGTAPMNLELAKGRMIDLAKAEGSDLAGFDRDFASLCFELATGVGKTRLMGAFIAWLHLAKGLRHFFILAPGLTVYEKLLTDFTPNTAKYVFRGLAEFALETPRLITADNYEDYRGYLGADLFGGIEINIFNIDKLRRDVGSGRSDPKMRRLQECLGKSYFDHLKSISDLILIMDESHRYRADAGMRALNELNPQLGLELTATAYTEQGKAGRTLFQNVLYRYPIAEALRDGFIKEPAVVTQRDFNPAGFTNEGLERFKLEDGVRLHEATKVSLDTYALQSGKKRVKPFILVVARSTDHAAELLGIVQSVDFFGGAYAGKAIRVDSISKDEEVERRLLAVEDPAEPTEIVIHVNMLKEGWDVTNLYTIIPLRSFDARTLIEQTLGRGLRLPYGTRTGVEEVDRLSVVAHDRFKEIVDEAAKPGSPLKIKTIILDTPSGYIRPVTVISQPALDLAFSSDTHAATPRAAPAGGGLVQQLAKTVQGLDASQQAVIKATLRVLSRHEHAPSLGSLAPNGNPTAALMQQVKAAMHTGPQLELDGVLMESHSDPMLSLLISQAVGLKAQSVIQIPRVSVQPSDDRTSGFHSFRVDCTSYTQQPVSGEILVQYLNDPARKRVIAAQAGKWRQEARPEDYLVRQLADYDDINYDQHADLLYDLASQVVQHLRSYLPDETAVTNVLQYYERPLAANLHQQMQPHYWEKASSYRPCLSKGWMELKDTAFTAETGQEARDFRSVLERASMIQRCVFTGFKKCLYSHQKFQSGTERLMAEILEDSAEVQKWFKPVRNQFQIFYRVGVHRDEKQYEPDFVVETQTQKLIIEIKGSRNITAPEVEAKTEAAVAFCEAASTHEQSVSGKPWRYILIPHDSALPNATVATLVSQFGR
jgi:type III restriction enzyme